MLHAGQVLGPFTIEKELGAGAMGTVFRARLAADGKKDQIVALKVIAFGLSGNDSALARFEREANILKQLKHPNIVRLLATGRYKNTPFFAMEFINGVSLDKVLGERVSAAPTRPPFTWEEVVDFGKQLCGALQHAHEKGIIHRDLKPSNLMLTTEGIMKLTDFGIAKDVDVTALTGANNTIGTAAYMSPEQCRGEKTLTGKSDIYSLGIVFYELLTGRKPFEAESSVDMFLMHVNGTFIRPAQINPEIPIWLDNLVCQMMEKKPDHRPRDAAMVGQVLDEIYEKVTSQKSAGADVAGARAVDRVQLTGAPSDDDRAAAKAIRAGSRKKKLRRKKRPLHTRGWFVITAVVLFLGAFGTLLWFTVLAPPSAESLLAKVESAADGDPKKEAIKAYLKYYGGRADEKTEHVKSLDRSIKAAALEHVLMNRHGRSNLRSTPGDAMEPEPYGKSMAALTAENEGDLAAAKNQWKALEETYAVETEESKGRWGWMAQKKLKDLAFVENWETTTLNNLKEKFLWNDEPIKIDDQHEARAVSALRMERLGDFSLARDRWKQLSDDLSKSEPKRGLFILAIYRSKALDTKKEIPKTAGERARLISDLIRLTQPLLKDAIPAKRRDARNVLRDIVDLYAGEKGEIGALVEQAKKLIVDNPT